MFFESLPWKTLSSSPVVHPSHGGWHHVNSQQVAIVGLQRLECCPPFYACFLIAPFLSFFLFLWRIPGKARESGGTDTRGLTRSGSSSRVARFAVLSALLSPWLTEDPSLWWLLRWITERVRTKSLCFIKESLAGNISPAFLSTRATVQLTQQLPVFDTAWPQVMGHLILT